MFVQYRNKVWAALTAPPSFGGGVEIVLHDPAMAMLTEQPPGLIHLHGFNFLLLVPGDRQPRTPGPLYPRPQLLMLRPPSSSCGCSRRRNACHGANHHRCTAMSARPLTPRPPQPNGLPSYAVASDTLEPFCLFLERTAPQIQLTILIGSS